MKRWLLVVLAGVLFMTACSGASDDALLADDSIFAGYEITPEPNVGDITLPAANRDTDAFAFKAQPGKLLMVNFGFASCPDICPTTLADTRLAFNQLGARSDDVDFAFVSIDPDRDSAEVLTNYVEAFLDNGIALRTDDADQLAVAADAFNVIYDIRENDQGELEVGHTPNIYLIDDTGKIILTWLFGVLTDDLVSDLSIMLDRQQAA